MTLLYCLIIPMSAPAGSLDATGPLTNGSGMLTTADIYNRLDTGAAGATPRIFREPASGPTVGTGRTLADIQGRLPVADTTNGALAEDVLQGKTFWGLRTDGTWGLKNGSKAVLALDPASTVMPTGYYAATNLATVDGDLAAANIKSGVTIFGVSGSLIQATGNASPQQVLSGSTFSNSTGVGLIGTMPNIGSFTVYPTTSDIVIPEGYHDGTGYVPGEPNLTPRNIRTGKTIFGVAGNLVDRALAKRVNKTGQVDCWDSSGIVVPCFDAGTGIGTGQDGEFQYGIDPAISPTIGVTGAYNTPPWTGIRFTVNGDGTVTDNLTALVWHKNATLKGTVTWQGALDYVVALNHIKGAAITDWRLPNINELHSLVDLTRKNPALPAPNPFTSVQLSYWSSTSDPGDTAVAWYVSMADGSVNSDKKSISKVYSVWPVRGGQ